MDMDVLPCLNGGILQHSWKPDKQRGLDRLLIFLDHLDHLEGGERHVLQEDIGNGNAPIVSTGDQVRS